MDNISTMLFDVLGLFGVAIYLLSYAALQLGLISGQSYLYSGLNIAAASLVLISLSNDFNLSSAIIQVSWIVLSLLGIARVVILTQRARFNEEEKQLIDLKFPGLPRHLARQFLNKGFWTEGALGTVLCTEGEAIDTLIYFAEGEASVAVSGQSIGLMQLQAFIGELTIMSDKKATATVTVTKKSRYFCLAADALKQMCQRSPVIHSFIISSFVVDSKQKLVSRNSEFIDSMTASEEAVEIKADQAR
jgi:CRP-like cAMP-binding protein